MKKVAIIGGGVSGVTLAHYLSNSAEVTIFEREDKLLLKLLKTGNGKANIYNRNIKINAYNDYNFMFEHFGHIEKTLDEHFAALKVLTFTDSESRVYPFSRSAHALREVLLKGLKAKVEVNTNIESVTRSGDGFSVNNEYFDYLVLATGSAAGLFKYDLTNNNDGLLESLELKRTTLVPVIKTIKVKEGLKVLHNRRVEALMSLWQDNNLLIKDRGEVLFKRDGLSGIVSFIISSYFEWAIKEKPKAHYKITLDLMPDHSTLEVKDFIKNEDDYALVFDTFLATYLKERRSADILSNVKALSFTPLALNYPENTQAISGGVPTTLINDDFSAKGNDHLFILGEVLNIDGICGGYNLGFAFYSAIVASRALLYKLSK